MKKKIINIIYKISCFIHNDLNARIVSILDKNKSDFIVYISIIFIVLEILTDLFFIEIIERIETKQKIQEEKERESPWWSLKKYGGWV
jgi:hypothetical protein